MFRGTMGFALLFIAVSLSAQTRFEAGLSLGTEMYGGVGEKMKLVAGGDVLFEMRRIGVHVAHEYTHRSSGRTFTALHTDGTYRTAFDERWSLLAGAGATFIHFESHPSDTTWNAELEFDRRFAHTEAYLRVRQYDYSFDTFRNMCSICSGGPAFSLGVRFRIHG